MRRLLGSLDKLIDDFSIKKKFLFFYIICVLFPLILTDSVVIYSVVHAEQESKRHAMESIASAVQYSFQSSVNRGSEIARSIYMNKYIDSFLNEEYEDPLDYYNSYLDFYKDTLLGNIVGIDNTIITMYSDNNTIINGNEFKRITSIKDSSWYNYLESIDEDQVLFFDYDDTKIPSIEAKRKILFIQRLNYYKFEAREKVLKIELDYSTVIRNLTKMNFDSTVYICSNGRILLSNGKFGNVGKDYDDFTEQNKVGYSQEMNLYGMDCSIIVLKPKFEITKEIIKNIPLIILLITINTVFPYILVIRFNKSFTERVGELSEVFKKVDSENLTEITYARGKDEIGSLMRNYNRMVARINALIQIVYINRIKEQEMTVARQNAELLALHSQINPHFLFNALESIRMHSVLKRENETADMVEKLSIMQRQYVEWGNDLVDISKELDFVRAYLGLQKYRFGDRLSFDIQIEEECNNYCVPKLSLVTFVENSCIHGIESKATAGWIFVRVYKKDNDLCMEIEDTGIGMSEPMMNDFVKRMNHANIDMLKDQGRVGIVNACLRLKMITEDNVRFELEGEMGSGLIVLINIPLRYLTLQERS